MDFAEVASAFEAVEAKSGRLEMIERLAQLFRKADASDLRLLMYLCQGKLAPDYANVEAGLGEKLVIQALARALGYSISTIERDFLRTGDLGEVGQRLATRKKQQSLYQEPLSVAKVHANLIRIAQSSGSGSQDSKIKLLAELFNSASPLETRYLVRFPLGQMRLGIGDPSILDALAEIHLDEFAKKNGALQKELETKYKKGDEARRQLRMRLRLNLEAAYNIHPDLGDLAKMLAEQGLGGLDSIRLEPGIPIRPTLAERLPSVEEITKKLGTCAVEAKYDGFRFAVHKDGENVFIFSRRMENMSNAFPEITRAIRTQLKPVRMICEGEALAIDPETGSFLSMQETIRRRRKYDVARMAEAFPLKLFLFDVQFIDGENLLPKPFEERRRRLLEAILPGPVIEATESRIISDARAMELFFQECVNQGLEGIMAKDLSAPYIAGARKFAWIKLKKSYRGEMSDSVDVVLCGYFKGRGNRTAFGLGALLGGVFNSERERFETVAKIGSGMTEAELTELHDLVQPLVRSKVPFNLDSDLLADVWLEPEIVIEVRADEITESPVHTCGRTDQKTGLALRFPRFIQLRTDKGPLEATTTSEIERLFEHQKKVRAGSKDFASSPNGPANE